MRTRGGPGLKSRLRACGHEVHSSGLGTTGAALVEGLSAGSEPSHLQMTSWPEALSADLSRRPRQTATQPTPYRPPLCTYIVRATLPLLDLPRRRREGGYQRDPVRW